MSVLPTYVSDLPTYVCPGDGREGDEILSDSCKLCRYHNHMDDMQKTWALGDMSVYLDITTSFLFSVLLVATEYINLDPRLSGFYIHSVGILA